MTIPHPPDAVRDAAADPPRDESFFRALFEAAGDAIIVCGEDGMAIDCNAATLEMYRCSRDQLIGTRPADWSPEFQPDGRRSDEAAAAVFAQVLAGEMARFEWEGRRTDGSTVDVGVSVRLTEIGERRIIVVVSRDITEKKHAQRLLRERDAIFREITESIREVFWVVTTDWRTVKYISPAIAEVYGIPPGRLYENGLAWLDAVLEAHRPALLAQIPTQESLAACRFVEFPDYEIRRPDGERRWIAARAYPIRDETGNVLHFAGISEDITRRKRAEAESARLGFAIDRVGDAVYVMDQTARFCYVNDVACHRHGYRREEMLNMGVPDIDADYPMAAWQGHWRTLKAEGTLVFETRHRNKDGQAFPVEVHANYFEYEGIGYNIALVSDISERKGAAEALRASEARYRSLADNSLDWVWTIDLAGRHTYSNDSCARILGYSREEFLQTDAVDLVHPDDVALFRLTFEQAIAERRGWSNVIVRWRAHDGDYRQLESSASPLLDAAGHLYGFQGMDRDVTERKRQEEAIWRQANFDTLTGLANRNLLHDRLERALAHARRTDTKVGLLFLDLDGFKWINDTLGHDAGDELLVEAARRLHACVRDQDTVARLGGDEFTLVVQDLADADDLQSIGEKAVGVLRHPFKLATGVHHLSASAGITVFPDDGPDVQTLLRCADIAMYQSKLAGKNRFQFYAPAMQAQAQVRVQIEADLRLAIAGREFMLHYQPIVDLESGKLVGAEALLRWQHPQQGMIAPLEFIPVAEESGLIVGLGEWVLREAARQWRQWRDAGHRPLRLAVNVSGIQFRDTELPALVAAVLDEYGVDHDSLVLEITESVLMGGNEATEARLREIKALGIGYALDDFGTGFSSLSYLKRFPVDIVKIDRSFVNDCPTDRNDAHLIEAIVTMAHSLNLRVAAEGVETAAQLHFLRRLRCDYLQGFLISKPVPAAEFEQLLKRQRLL